MEALKSLGISREDILDRAASKLLDSLGEYSGDLAAQVKADCTAAIVAQAKPKINDILASALDGLVDAEFTPVDEWGEPTRKATTLRQMVKDRALSYLTEQVNDKGKPAGYQVVGSRAEWMAGKVATDAISYEVKQELTKAVESAKGKLKKQVAEHIAKTILK